MSTQAALHTSSENLRKLWLSFMWWLFAINNDFFQLVFFIDILLYIIMTKKKSKGGSSILHKLDTFLQSFLCEAGQHHSVGNIMDW